MSKLRAAVVGAGRLGGFHARKLAARADVELVAVVDPDAVRREKLAAECAARPLADHRELLGQIDAAVLASPTSLHFQQAAELLDADVHLLVEKPLTTAADEGEVLVGIAQRRKLVLQVGHVERFNPAFQAAAAAVPGPKFIEAVRAGRFTFRSTDVGAVLDLMIHDIELVLSLVRSPLRRVDALGLSVLGGHEDVAHARLEFQSGCVAQLGACRVGHEPARRMTLWSLEAFASVDFAAGRTTTVRPSQALRERKLDVRSLTPETIEQSGQQLLEEHLVREDLAYPAVDAIALEVDDFVESIRTGKPPRVTGQQAAEAVAVAELVLARIRDHAWDGTARGRIGPLALPAQPATPPWLLRLPERPPLKEAG